MAENALGHRARGFSDAPEFIAQGGGRERARFGHVNRPVVIERVRHLHADAGEFVVLVLRPAEAEPVSRHEESVLPIDVETLVRVPAAGARGGLVARLREPRVMREHERLDLDERLPKF